MQEIRPVCDVALYMTTVSFPVVGGDGVLTSSLRSAVNIQSITVAQV